MNKIFVILFLLTCTIFPQSGNNLLLLKSQLKQSINLTDVQTVSVNAEFSKKNVALAVVYSLLLPGMGELYAGNYSSGKFFTIAEGALWGTYIGMNTYSNWQKDRYHSFAASNGGASILGKNDEYFGNIGIWENIDEYNDDMARSGDFNKMYNPVSEYWKWSGTDRKTYRAMWTAGEQSHNNLRFVIGALVLNRVVSAINAARLVAAYNKNASQELGWNVSAGLSENNIISQSYTLNFRYDF
jgi:hypothetical protein